VIGVSLILFVLCYTEPVLYQLGPFNCEKCIHQPECSWCQKNHPCVNTTSTINKISSDAPSLPLSRRYLGANSDASDNSSDNIFKNHHAQSTNVEYQDLMDGYSNQQWALDMIKVPDVWSQGIFGRGVRVRVNDDGVEEANPHWKDRFDIGGSCDNQGEYLSSSSMEHGTSVASIIGASNELDGTCTLGVAPSITLSSCYALAPSEAFLGEKVEAMDISSNSFERPACKSNSEDSSQNRNLEFTEEHQCPFRYYDFRPEYDPCLKCGNFSSEIGYNDKYGRSSECIDAIVEHCNSYYEVEKEACSEFLDLIIGGECSYVGLSTVARDSIIKGITEGRGGKGIVYVFASGNSYFTGDDTNVKGYTSTVRSRRCS
jgi:subtilisin family serine protease